MDKRKSIAEFIENDINVRYEPNIFIYYNDIVNNNEKKIGINIRDIINFKYENNINDITSTLTLTIPKNIIFQNSDLVGDINLFDLGFINIPKIDSIERLQQLLKVYKVTNSYTGNKLNIIEKGTTIVFYLNIIDDKMLNNYNLTVNTDRYLSKTFYFTGYLNEISFDDNITMTFEGPMNLLRQNHVLFPISDNSKNVLFSNKILNNKFKFYGVSKKKNKKTDVSGYYKMKLKDYINEVLLFNTKFYNKIFCDIDTDILIKRFDCNTAEALKRLKDLFPGLYIYFKTISEEKETEIVEDTLLFVTTESGRNKKGNSYIDYFLFSDIDKYTNSEISLLNLDEEFAKLEGLIDVNIKNSNNIRYKDAYFYNCITNINELKYQKAEDTNVIVKASSFDLKTGQAITVTYPEKTEENIPYSSVVIFNGENMDKNQLLTWAKLKSEKYKFTGFTGSFDAPLLTYCDITDIVFLYNLSNNDRNGFYILRGITLTGDESGVMQKIELGSKYS